MSITKSDHEAAVVQLMQSAPRSEHEVSVRFVEATDQAYWTQLCQLFHWIKRFPSIRWRPTVWLLRVRKMPLANLPALGASNLNLS